MSDFKSRLTTEFTELNVKMDALNKFIQSDKFNEIDQVQASLLKIQLSAMLTYSGCLEERLELL